MGFEDLPWKALKHGAGEIVGGFVTLGLAFLALVAAPIVGGDGAFFLLVVAAVMAFAGVVGIAWGVIALAFGGATGVLALGVDAAGGGASGDDSRDGTDPLNPQLSRGDDGDEQA